MNYGIVLVGTNVNPLIISLDNMWNHNIEKVFLLATTNRSEESEIKTNNIKYTEEYCNKVIEIFKERNLQKVIIDRCNINLMKKTIDDKILKVIDSDEDLDKKIFLDFTGGTKIQSAFIKEYISLNWSGNKNYSEFYVDGDSETIIAKYSGDIRPEYEPIKDLSMANNEKVIEYLSYIKGYEYIKERNSIKNIRTNIEYKFDSIFIKDYKLYFRKNLKNKLGKKVKENNGREDYKGKEKVKLELFETIINSEIIGEDFCKIEIGIPNEEHEDILRGQLLGIRKDYLNKRIDFIEVEEEEEK